MNNTNKTDFAAIILGTGTPNADPERSGPSVAIVAGGSPYIVDAGPGVVRRASAAYRNGIDALDVSKLDTLFLTHLHSDHTAGYPDLILTPWVLDRESPLRVFGPPGTSAMTQNILDAYKLDIDERIKGQQPSNEAGIIVDVTEIETGTIFEDENISVEAFQVKHGGLESYAYKFISGSAKIVISGDTAPFDGLIDFYRCADILIHEVYSTEGFRNYPPDWQRYHSTVHTSSEELANIASGAKPGLLVLYHQLFNGVSETKLLAEITSKYNGQVVSAKDLDMYSV